MHATAQRTRETTPLLRCVTLCALALQRNVLGCVHTDEACAREYGLKLAILAAFTIPNLLSSQLVGRIVTALALFVLAPFAALTVVGIPQVCSTNH